MDRHWRAASGPTQGNICPRCSTPHYPFCPPNPPHPRFPAVNNPLNIDPMDMQTQPPVSSYAMLDPFHAPRYWERNPNPNPNPNSNSSHNSQYHHIQSPSVPGDPGNANHTRGGYLPRRADYGVNAIGAGPGSDHGMNDRSSKRLKMDGAQLDSYAPNPALPVSSDHERRLKLIHEHGRVMNGLAPSGRDYYDGRTNTLVENRSHGGPHSVGHPDQTKYEYGAASHLKYSYPKISATLHHANLHNGSHYTPTEEIDVQPPLPTTPPPPPPALPPPLDTPGKWITHPKRSTAPTRSSFLFPVDVRSSTPAHSIYLPAHSLVPGYQHISESMHSAGGLFSKDSQGPQTAMYLRSGQVQPVLSNHNVLDKPKIIDAVSLFKPPNRDRRPDHFVIILRGLPGSGKSYLARMLRDLEVENGGKAPRIHSMDDYFMTEIDKVEENETSTSSGRGKKPVVKKELEYCYEPEMEEAYRSSMLKAFKKTLDEGSFTFVIVDDRNLRVADFAQFWATAKRSGYEVYLLEASYKDPMGCTARNIHGFTRDDVENMAKIWEEAPSLYLQLDAKSLFHGENSKESNIQEVDMDMGDEDLYRGSSESEERKHEDGAAKTSEEIRYDVSKKTWNAEADHPDEEVKDLRCSKWSGDLDEDNVEGSDKKKCKSSVLSGFFQAYGREGKSVHWGDQIPNTGFSIGAMTKANTASLVIGPGSGYNLKSNPLPVEESHSSAQKSGDVKKPSVFQEHLRAEKESFKAVFDRRRQRQRIGGLGLEEDREDRQ